MKLIKKAKKLVPSIITLLILTIVFPFSANAATLDSSETVNNNSDDIVVYLNSEEELQIFEQELDEQNALAEQKWQEALERADKVSPILQNKQTTSVTPFNALMSTSSLYYAKYYTIKFEKGTLLGGNDYFTGYLYLVGSTSLTSSGLPYFSSVSSITFASADTKNTVESFTYQKAMLDSNRTCAVNGSCYITVYVSGTNSHRYPLSFYREFYASQNY